MAVEQVNLCLASSLQMTRFCIALLWQARGGEPTTYRSRADTRLMLGILLPLLGSPPWVPAVPRLDLQMHSQPSQWGRWASEHRGG